MEKYFKLSTAWKDVKNSHGSIDTATSVVKMVGKILANTVVFGVTEVVPGMAKATVESNIKNSEKILKRDDVDSERRKKLEEFNCKSKETLERIKEREKN